VAVYRAPTVNEQTLAGIRRFPPAGAAGGSTFTTNDVSPAVSRSRRPGRVGVTVRGPREPPPPRGRGRFTMMITIPFIIRRGVYPPVSRSPGAFGSAAIAGGFVTGR